VDKKKEFKEFMSTENTEATELELKNKKYDFSVLEFVRAFRAFRGQKKRFNPCWKGD
jgi:hypothetical protein